MHKHKKEGWVHPILFLRTGQARLLHFFERSVSIFRGKREGIWLEQIYERGQNVAKVKETNNAFQHYWGSPMFYHQSTNQLEIYSI